MFIIVSGRVHERQLGTEHGDQLSLAEDRQLEDDCRAPVLHGEFLLVRVEISDACLIPLHCIGFNFLFAG